MSAGAPGDARRRVIICVTVLGLLDAIVYGLSFPVFSVTLEENGLAPSLIGLSATLGALGALLCGTQFPRLIRRMGYRGFTAAAFSAGLVAMAGLLLSDHVVLWFALRIVLYVALAGLWVSTDAWFSSVVTESHRGFSTGVFQALYCFGFFVGPSITYVTGGTGPMPVLVMVALCASALFVLRLTKDAPRRDTQAGEPVRWREFHRIPGTFVVLYLAFLVGTCETAVYTLLPIYGIDRGLPTESAVGLLVAYTLGEAVIALPVGWLADRVDREWVLTLCAVFASGCFFLLTVAVGHIPSALAVAFLAGGLLASVFNMSIVLIGQTFDGTVLATVITAFTMSYSLGGVGGSAIGGGLMDLFGPGGLPVFLGAAVGCSGLALFLLVITRRLSRRGPGQNSRPGQSSAPRKDWSPLT